MLQRTRACLGWLHQLLLLLLLPGCCLAGKVLGLVFTANAISSAFSLASLAVSQTRVLEGASPCTLAKIYSKPFIILVTLLLNWVRANSWTALKTPYKLEETHPSQRISVQLLSVHTVNTSFLHHQQLGMVDVPCEGGHGLVLWSTIRSSSMYTE